MSAGNSRVIKRKAGRRREKPPRAVLQKGAACLFLMWLGVKPGHREEGSSDGKQRKLVTWSRGRAKETTFLDASQQLPGRKTTVTKTRKTAATVIEMGHNLSCISGLVHV